MQQVTVTQDAYNALTWSSTFYLWHAILKPTQQDLKMCFSYKWEVSVRILSLMCYYQIFPLFIDRPAVVGKRSRPQYQRQIRVHSPSQSVCQGQPPPHPAAAQTERLHQHPGLTGQHTTVRVDTYLTYTTLGLSNTVG